MILTEFDPNKIAVINPHDLLSTVEGMLKVAVTCICVDMECSADAAVAQFRGKDLVQFFYAADNLDAEE